MRIDGSARFEGLVSWMLYAGAEANRSLLVSKTHSIRAFFAAKATVARA
jgi:hypothetical protein